MFQVPRAVAKLRPAWWPGRVARAGEHVRRTDAPARWASCARRRQGGERTRRPSRPLHPAPLASPACTSPARPAATPPATPTPRRSPTTLRGRSLRADRRGRSGSAFGPSLGQADRHCLLVVVVGAPVLHGLRPPRKQPAVVRVEHPHRQHRPRAGVPPSRDKRPVNTATILLHLESPKPAVLPLKPRLDRDPRSRE